MQRFREERERAAHALEEERQKRLRLLQEKILVGKLGDCAKGFTDSPRKWGNLYRFIGCTICGNHLLYVVKSELAHSVYLNV